VHVWHGGRAYFTEFSENEIGSGEGDSLGWGFYFAEHRKGGEYFAEYLNFRNGAGYLYEAELELAEEEILHLDVPVLRMNQHTKLRISNIFPEIESSFDAHAIYQALRNKLGDKPAADELRKAGILAIVTYEGTKPSHGQTFLILEKSRIKIIETFKFSKNPYAWQPFPNN